MENGRKEARVEKGKERSKGGGKEEEFFFSNKKERP